MATYIICIYYITEYNYERQGKIIPRHSVEINSEVFIINKEVAISMQPLYVFFNLYKTKKKQTTQKDTNAPFKLSITLS